MLLTSKTSFVRCSINSDNELLSHFFLGSYRIKNNCGVGKEEILVLECSSHPDLFCFFPAIIKRIVNAISQAF